MLKPTRALIGFGQIVRINRQSHGLNQTLFAGKCGLNRTYLSELERGKRNPSLLTIECIAKALRISISALCTSIDS